MSKSGRRHHPRLPRRQTLASDGSTRLRFACATAATDLAASRGGERGRDVHDQDGIVLGIVEQASSAAA